MKKLNFEDLKNHWPSTLVARQSIGEFSGGILNPRTMANLDSRGEGPKGRVRTGGRKIAYDVEELISWLQNRSELVDHEDEPDGSARNQAIGG